MSSCTKNLFSCADKWHVDEIIMKWWNAKNEEERNQIKLECYKELKALNFNPDLRSYLQENNAEDLADKVDHFIALYKKVPHEHEARKAA